MPPGAGALLCLCGHFLAGLSEIHLCQSSGPLETGDSNVRAPPCAWTAATTLLLMT